MLQFERKLMDAMDDRVLQIAVSTEEVQEVIRSASKDRSIVREEFQFLFA